jgi:hypothetical protein
MSFNSLVTDAVGNTYALTANRSYYGGITSIYKFNGTSWSDIGGSNLPNGFQTTSLAIDASGNVYASGSDLNSSGEVYKWDGISWTNIGGAGFWTMDIDPNGNVYGQIGGDIYRYGY